MDVFSPPVAFHFVVAFAGMNPPVADMAFKEVGGLTQSVGVEDVVEGGENRFVHQLPKPAKSPNLTLKRGLTTMASGLVIWCKNTLENDFAKRIEPKDVVVSLLNADRIPVASWSVTNAYPVKWEVGGFDAMENKLAIETFELAYNVLKRRM